jgi:mono/diheme cytochrome c family protein
MKRVIAFLFLIILGACGKTKDPATRGRAYFMGLGCNTCHVVGGEGGGQTGPDLTYVGFRKTPEWLDLWMKDPAAWKPGTAMPNFQLTDAVRSDLVAYMSTLTGEPYRQNPPWNKETNSVKWGEDLFNFVGCVGCHGTQGTGGYVNNNVVGGKIPALTFVADGYSREELREQIENGEVSEPADHTQPPPLINMPSWKKMLTSDEIEALVDYVTSLRPAAKPEDDWSQ